MVIVPGSTVEALAASLSGLTGIPVVKPCVSKFSDGEINVELPSAEVAECEHVVLVQSLCAPANENFMELMLLADASRRAFTPERITAVVPYLCYSRQDRILSRVGTQGTLTSALSSKVIANLFGASGIDRVVTVDLHSSQIVGYFDVDCINLSTHSVFTKEISESHILEKLVVVAPDCGALSRVREFVRVLSGNCNINSVQIAMIDKYRESPGVSEVMHVVGNVKDRHCLILDDIVDSGGTLCNAAAALKARGAMSVHGCITHGVLSGEAVSSIEVSELNSLIITDTIHNSKLSPEGKIKVCSVSRLLGNYIVSTVLRG